MPFLMCTVVPRPVAYCRCFGPSTRPPHSTALFGVCRMSVVLISCGSSNVSLSSTHVHIEALEFEELNDHSFLCVFCVVLFLSFFLVFCFSCFYFSIGVCVLLVLCFCISLALTFARSRELSFFSFVCRVLSSEL